MTAIYFSTILIILLLYWRIDKTMVWFNVLIMVMAVIGLIGVIETREVFIYWQLANYFIIFLLILFLAGLNFRQGFLIDCVFMLITWYVNIPELLHITEISLGNIIEIKKNYESELFIISGVFLLKSTTNWLKKTLLLGHSLMYAITTLPIIGFSEYLKSSWQIQQYLAISYNLWWVITGVVYLLIKRRSRALPLVPTCSGN